MGRMEARIEETARLRSGQAERGNQAGPGLESLLSPHRPAGMPLITPGEVTPEAPTRLEAWGPCTSSETAKNSCQVESSHLVTLYIPALQTLAKDCWTQQRVMQDQLPPLEGP